MNNNQISSIVRLILNFVSGAIIAWSASKSQPAKDFIGYVVQFINGPDCIAAAMTFVAWLWGHVTHATPPAPPSSPTGSASKIPLFLALCLVLPVASLSTTGCKSSPQAVTYQTAGTISVTVESALKAYDVFASQGKTTTAQNAAVKSAYEKYQAAFVVVCDAGAVYAATGSTNAPAAAALQTAILNASQTVTDLVNLIRSFGVAI